MTYIQNTHRFRGFKLPFADWLKFSLIEELTYEKFLIEYIHTVHARGPDASQIFLRNAHVLLKLPNYLRPVDPVV
jgi:hypothetical protein